MSSNEPDPPNERSAFPAVAPRTPATTADHLDEAPMARSWWDVITGGILIGTGVVVLGDVAVAGVISVKFLGWTLIIGGLISIGAALWRSGRNSFWVGLLGGGLALIAGLVMIRHPGATLVLLSTAIGAVMLINGIVRLVAAVQQPASRLALAVSGGLSLGLGLLIFMQWPTSALWLIGTLLGVQLFLDGLALILVGRAWPAA